MGVFRTRTKGAKVWQKVHGSPLSQVRCLLRRGGVTASAQFGSANQREKTWHSKLIATFADGTFVLPKTRSVRPPHTSQTYPLFLFVVTAREYVEAATRFSDLRRVWRGNLRIHLIAVILPAFDLPFNVQRSPHSAWVGWSSYKYPERLIGLSLPLHPLNGFQSFSPCCIVSQSLFPLSCLSPLS